jgi:hypothetical protein
VGGRRLGCGKRHRSGCGGREGWGTVDWGAVKTGWSTAGRRGAVGVAGPGWGAIATGWHVVGAVVMDRSRRQTGMKRGLTACVRRELDTNQ